MCLIKWILLQLKLPSAELDVNLIDYVRIICSILDIPVHSNNTITESLHTLFSLYSAFKENAHFQTGQTGSDGGAHPNSETGISVGGADILSL
jgi:intraflagellar transport protein 46